MAPYDKNIDIRKIGINRTGLTVKTKCRYSLTIDFENDNKQVLVVIMMNPSHANEVSSDETVNTVIDYALTRYDKLFVFNVLPIVAPSNENFKNIEDLDFHCKKNLDVLSTEIGYLIKSKLKIDVILATGSPKDFKDIFDRELQKIYEILFKNLKNIDIKSVSHNGKKLKDGKYTFHPSRKLKGTFQPEKGLIIINDSTGEYVLK